MRFVINLVLCVLVVPTGSTQTRGQSSVVPPLFTPGHTGASASPDLTEDPGSEVPQWTHNPTGRNETSTQPTAAVTKTERTFYSQTAEYTTNMLSTSSAGATAEKNNTPAFTTQPDILSFTPTVPTPSPTESTVLLTTEPLTTFSSQHTSSTDHASLTMAPTQQTTTGRHQSSAPARAAGPTHQEVPAELNVGDEDFKGPRLRPSSPLDPLLAGLLSVFIVTTAIVFVILFLKFRQRTNHPEFHRLQDLPMDDLMEDTPLSRYSY
ncbi:rho family-interacting cell polarization regulator 1-like isoform X2 [Sphaeramia orbicularis]|uniref:Cell wall protein DAN4-like n=1 Tax=Sphaeramia orbicularis TaxID=375764 RepID=A0A673BHZ7_9TELE|nr:rho family-interacting cell polarization regulator 1-like isoform X2 [Sphaeramia orbicularis]